MNDPVCHVMNDGEILNAAHEDYPLYEAIIYGSRLECAKLSKRLSCSIHHLPLRVRVRYVYDTLKALEAGVTKDPGVTLNGEVFLEGLVQAETITEAFEIYLRQ